MHINPLTRSKRLKPPRANFTPLQTQQCNRFFGQRLFRKRHLLKILGAQNIIGRGGEGRINLDGTRFFLPFVLGLHLVKHGFRQPSKTGIPGLVCRSPCDLLEHELHELFQHFRLFPEYMESLVKQLLVLAPLHQNCMQRPIEIFPGSKRAAQGGINCVQNRSRPHGQSGLAQHPAKMHDILGELA